MHNKIIKQANAEQLREFIKDTMSMLEATNTDLYASLEDHLYKKIYGNHFSDWLLEEALNNMINEDGTTGGHWTLDQTDQVAKDYQIRFDKFNKYDWCYVMNMIYSDYFGAIPNNTDAYVKLAKCFLMDKDGINGKAYHYYSEIAR